MEKTILLLIILVISFLLCEAGPKLLILDQTLVRSHDLATNTSGILVPALFQRGFAMDYHYGNQKLYVSDTVEDKIYEVDLSVTPPVSKVLVDTGLSIPGGVAVDWINNNLYWTDSDKDQINVLDLDSQKRATLVDTHLYDPRAIAVDPRDGQGWLYYTDFGFKHGIYRSGLDGKGRTTLLDDNLALPNSITIDYTTNTLYWIDGSLHQLGSYNLGGGTVNPSIVTGLARPFSVVVFGGSLYWSEFESETVKTISLSSPQDVRNLTTQLSYKPRTVLVYDSSRQPSGTAVCGSDNNGCSHVCLPSRLTTSSCACPSGSALASNGKTCITDTSAHTPSIDHALVVADMDDTGLSRLSFFKGDPHVWLSTEKITSFSVTSNSLVKKQNANIAAVSFGYRTRDVYVADNGNRLVERFVRPIQAAQGGFVIPNFNISSQTSGQINGLAVDWLSDSVYMTDTLNGRITVCNGHRIDVCRYIVTGLNNPFGIAVHPGQGWMVWTSQGNPGSLEKSRLDGKNRKILVSGIIRPMGVAIDYKENLIYYIDQLLSRVVKVNFNGGSVGNPHVITEQPNPIQLWDITIYDELGFVTDKGNKKVHILHLDNYKKLTLTLTRTLSGITMFEPGKQTPGPRPCENLNCGDICVTTEPGSAICMCREEFKLSEDGKNCAPESGDSSPTASPPPKSSSPEAVSVTPKSATSTDSDDNDKFYLYVEIGVAAFALFVIVIIVVTVAVVVYKKKRRPAPMPPPVVFTSSAAGKKSDEPRPRYANNYVPTEPTNPGGEINRGQGQVPGQGQIPGQRGESQVYSDVKSLDEELHQVQSFGNDLEGGRGIHGYQGQFPNGNPPQYDNRGFQGPGVYSVHSNQDEDYMSPAGLQPPAYDGHGSYGYDGDNEELVKLPF